VFLILYAACHFRSNCWPYLWVDAPRRRQILSQQHKVRTAAKPFKQTSPMSTNCCHPTKTAQTQRRRNVIHNKQFHVSVLIRVHLNAVDMSTTKTGVGAKGISVDTNFNKSSTSLLFVGRQKKPSTAPTVRIATNLQSHAIAKTLGLQLRLLRLDTYQILSATQAISGTS